VPDALDVQQLVTATHAVGKQLGGIDRILGTLEQLQVQLGQLRDHFGVSGMGEAASRNFRDKARMKDVLRGAGVPCARHRRLTSVAEGWVFAREVGFPMIIKPPDAAAAKGTHRITDAKGLHDVLNAVRPSPERPAVAEEFVTGRERSFETVTIRGRAVWDSSMRYDPAPLHVLENPWIQWTVLLPREVETADTQAVRPYARAALEALGMGTGISHMEWFRRDRSAGGDAGPVAISEVGARPPGAQIMSINSYAHDVDFYKLWARLVVHEMFDPPANRRFAAGAAFFRGQGGDPTALAASSQSTASSRRRRSSARWWSRPSCRSSASRRPRATRARATRSFATPTPACSSEPCNASSPSCASSSADLHGPDPDRRARELAAR
jgi:biotin carboxylase